MQAIREATKQYEVTILGINRSSQWKTFDEQLVEEHSLNYSALSLGRENFFSWLMVGVIHKVCIFLYSFFKQSIILSAFASSKVHILLWNHLRRENRRFDLIIGHSGSSLFPAWKYAVKQKIPFMFDVEDYYPAEHMPVDPINEKLHRELLLKKLLPEASCITVASPLIGERIKSLIGKRTLKNIVLINNCFPEDEFKYIETFSNFAKNIPNIAPLAHSQISTFPHYQINKVHFVWFSQNIASNRGLEFVIPELSKIRDKVHLHLIGNLYTGFKNEWIDPYIDFISTYPPIPQKELNRFICHFDVGLAIEPGKDENNLIAVSNKIWAYLQAGLYIMATSTPAQVGFMKEHEGHGVVFAMGETQKHENATREMVFSVEEALEFLISNIEKIRQRKQERFNRANMYSWEKESIKLQSIWDIIITDG